MKRSTPRNQPGKSLKKALSQLSLFALLSQNLTGSLYANAVGSDMQNFNPTTSGLDFVTVQSSETLEPGFINLGFFLNYAVNTLPRFKDEGQNVDTDTHFRDSLLGGDLNAGIGLMKDWDLGISLPQVIFQNADSEGERGRFSDTGNTEVRFNTKYRLWGTNDYGVAVVGSTNINRTKKNPYTGDSSSPIYNLELAADTTIESISLGANIGYRWRKPGKAIAENAPIKPLENQYIASVAASYLFSDLDTKVIFEVFGSAPATSSETNVKRLSSSSEALLGVKHDVTSQIAINGGLGKELEAGRSSPDYRVYTGLNWTFGPSDTAPVVAAVAPPAEKPTTGIFSGAPKAYENIVVHDVLFGFDSDQITTPSSRQTMAELAKHLTEGPGYTKLIIEGHTDSVGSDAYNLELSQKRANAIRRWLIEKHGLDPQKIASSGFGERKPVADNGNFQGRQLNRRVEFKIYRDMK